MGRTCSACRASAGRSTSLDTTFWLIIGVILSRLQLCTPGWRPKGYYMVNQLVQEQHLHHR
jgi:hypothetical protein